MTGKDASDYMLEEYVQTNLHFFHLQNRLNDWFKTFIALYGVPFTVLAAVTGIGDGIEGLDLFELPGIVVFLLAIIAFLGFFVAMMIINMRMEMILHKRAVNDVRRYFAQIDTGNPSIAGFLVLPTSDRLPPFYERWRDTFWQVLLIGLLDSFTLYFSIANLIQSSFVVLAMVALTFWALHWFAYWATARRREVNWQSLHPEDLQTANY